MEGPSRGPHCHAVTGAGAQVPEDVTPGTPTQRHAPNATAGGCVVGIHHVAFCSSPLRCPGDLQRGGRGAAQGEVGRVQGIWKAQGGSQPLCATAHCSVLGAGCFAQRFLGLWYCWTLAPSGWGAGWPPEIMGTTGQTVQVALSTISPGVQLDMPGEIPGAFEVDRRDWICVQEGVRTVSSRVGHLYRSQGHSGAGLGWGRWWWVLCKAQVEALGHSGVLGPTQPIRLTCPLGDVGGGSFERAFHGSDLHSKPAACLQVSPGDVLGIWTQGLDPDPALGAEAIQSDTVEVPPAGGLVPERVKL